MFSRRVLGIDVGGSGIKGAPVDTKTGLLLTDRYRIPTPEGALPDEVARVIAQISDYFRWKGPIGCGFPAAIRDGVALTAANIDKSWVGQHIPSLIEKHSGCKAVAVNDADAAGIAEMTHGLGKNKKGNVLFLTVGTGIGSALFRNGILFPNTELGHIEMFGGEAERYASDAVRKNLDLSWKDWAKRFNEYLDRMEKLFWPRTIILGGGLSRKFEKIGPLLKTRAELFPAQLRNEAGIIGAAMAYHIL